MNQEKTFNNKKNLLDKCNSSIGISIGLRNKNNKIVSGIFDPIIWKGSSIPCIRSKTYYTLYDNQHSTEIKVYQGNGQYVDDNLLIGKFILKDIPKSPAGRQKIELIFYYDSCGILNITAKVYGNGKVFKTTMNTLEMDKDIISFDNNIDYNNWEKYNLAYLVKAVIKYSEEKIPDLNSREAREIDMVLKKIKKYLFLNNEDMVKKYKKKLIYLLSETG